MPPAPLVVTLLLDATSQDYFDALRRSYFPPERNHLAAHVTLFHALPGEREAEVDADLGGAARRPAFDVAVTGVRFLGRGVAYDLASGDLDDVRAELGQRWRDVLTPQDRRPSRPHVTVQNKVAPDVARALHARLSEAFAPWTARGTGLALWRYVGGPWDPVATYPFS